MRKLVVRSVPGWPRDKGGDWIKRGRVGDFADDVVNGSRSSWFADAPAPPKPKRKRKPKPKPDPVEPVAELDTAPAGTNEDD